MRRRITYANVMATLALFFALTGASMAGVKYIAASDRIPAPSDLAGSTYGNPLIAAGKVTTGKIADGAIATSKFDGTAKAPDAEKLDGMDSTAFPTILGRGTVTFNGNVLAAGDCATSGIGAPGGTNASTDFVLAQRPSGGLGFNASVVGGFGSILGELIVEVTVCNVTPSQVTLSGTYTWLVLHSG